MKLIVCAACGCHARALEKHCPHCDAPILRKDGSRAVSVAALVAGLTVVTAAGACVDETDTSNGATSTSDNVSVVASYGGSPSFSSSGGFGGVGGVENDGGMGGAGGMGSGGMGSGGMGSGGMGSGGMSGGA